MSETKQCSECKNTLDISMFGESKDARECTGCFRTKEALQTQGKNVVVGEKSDKNNTQADLEKVQRDEQERTTIKKRLFLEQFEKSMCIVSKSCEKVGIDRATLYRWRKEDAQFERDYMAILYRENEQAEEVLKALVKSGDAGAVKFFLSRKHPGYKAKVAMEHLPVGQKTLEDLLDEQEINDEKNERGTDTGAIENPGQAGPVGALQAEPGATVLPVKADAPKSDTESPAKGNK